MPRRRTGTVNEPIADLRRLLKRYSGTYLEPRAQMLIRIKSDPHVLMITLADDLRVSEKTLRRWWTDYRAGGLGALLGDPDRPAGGRGRRKLQQASFNPMPFDSGIISILNRLPRESNSREWVEKARQALQRMLNVDRVTLAVNAVASA